MYLEFKKLSTDAKMPTSAYPQDAGYDLYALSDFIIGPNATEMINTGIAFKIPKGHYGRIADRSSMGKKGITVFGGVVDSSYRGEVKVLLHNTGEQTYKISLHDKIAQIILTPYIKPELKQVTTLEETERGEKGFGSSG